VGSFLLLLIYAWAVQPIRGVFHLGISSICWFRIIRVLFCVFWSHDSWQSWWQLVQWPGTCQSKNTFEPNVWRLESKYKFKRRIGDHCIGVVKCESKNSDIEYSQYPVTFVLCSVWIHDRLFRKGNNKGFHYPYMLSGVCGNTIGWGTALQAVGPNGVIGILFVQNTSGYTMALWLAQPLTEMNPRNISWGVKAVSA